VVSLWGGILVGEVERFRDLDVWMQELIGMRLREKTCKRAKTGAEQRLEEQPL